MRKFLLVTLALFALLSVTAPAFAHHSFAAEFDGDKLITLKGTLTRVEWANPHMWFYMDVKDENGKVSNWGFENTSITFIRRQYPDARKVFVSNIGQTIYVVACPAKVGESVHRAAAEAIRFGDGTIVAIPGGGGGYKGGLDEIEILKAAK